MTNVLENQKFQCRVSSTLNKDVTQFGKSYMFDGNGETCWASDPGSPQWIAFQWEKNTKLTAINIQFQGGFVGQDCEVVAWKDGDNKLTFPFYPNDNNSLQSFSIDSNDAFKKITIKFGSSTDLFGRIIIYKLSIFS